MNPYGNSSNPRQTIIVVEDPNRNFGYGPAYPTLPWWWRPRWRTRRYYGGYSNRPYWWRPYYQRRPRFWSEWRSDPNWLFWDRLKLVAITVIATPVVLVELAILLDYLRR